MGFRLVPKSVTLNGAMNVFLQNLVALGADLVGPKWSKIDLYSLRRKFSPKNLVFSDMSLMAIFTENA